MKEENAESNVDSQKKYSSKVNLAGWVYLEDDKFFDIKDGINECSNFQRISLFKKFLLDGFTLKICSV